MTFADVVTLVVSAITVFRAAVAEVDGETLDQHKTRVLDELRKLEHLLIDTDARQKDRQDKLDQAVPRGK